MRRRTFVRGLVGAGSTLLLPALSGCGDSRALREPDGREVAFNHGVASGDPLADRVILWTRVTPAVHGQIDGRWEVARDTGFNDVVRRGVFVTDADRDYTVKIDADGLEPGQWYYYRFVAGGHTSPAGRTRTLPVGRVERLRIAYTSCSNYPAGYFTVYGAMAARNDVDVVLHLGDYIYEYGDGEYGGDRQVEPAHEIVALEDYRTRHALYKTDPDLQEVHRQYPMIVVWDDHESTNNSWRDGADNHTEGEEGEWNQRKHWSIQAFHEWLPIRMPDPLDPTRIWRSFNFGDLVDLMMLDTRLYGRDEPLVLPIDPRRLDPNRELLGRTQHAWLGQQMLGSTAVWQLLGQQVMMGQLRLLTLPNVELLGLKLLQELIALNLDQWDGFVAARSRVFDLIESAGRPNVVVLTGDIHSSWGIELYRDPGALDNLVSGIVGNLLNIGIGPRPLAVEFVTPSVTSSGLPEGITPLLQTLFVAADPHIKYFQGDRHGYVLLDITRERMQTEWHFIDRIDVPQSQATMAQSVIVRAGEGRIRPGGAETGRADNPSPAP